MRSLTRAVTTLLNATPITTPTAISTTLPRSRNCLKPPISFTLLRPCNLGIHIMDQVARQGNGRKDCEKKRGGKLAPKTGRRSERLDRGHHQALRTPTHVETDLSPDLQALEAWRGAANRSTDYRDKGKLEGKLAAALGTDSAREVGAVQAHDHAAVEIFRKSFTIECVVSHAARPRHGWIEEHFLTSCGHGEKEHAKLSKSQQSGRTWCFGRTPSLRGYRRD